MDTHASLCAVSLWIRKFHVLIFVLPDLHDTRFDVLLTAHLGIILVINKLNAQNLVL